MFEYLMLSDVRAQKYSKTGTHTRSILEKFAFDTTLNINSFRGTLCLCGGRVGQIIGHPIKTEVQEEVENLEVLQ